MKNIYVILAFHAHELLWDLPEMLLSTLEEGNPMKDTFQDENYIKKREKEGRDIYEMCSKFGDRIDAPLSVEYTNELLHQIKEVIPETFKMMQEDYRRGRLYPLYGHAHHTHVSLMGEEEITQETMWNMQYLHDFMGVPYPKYKGLFPSEASLSHHKLEGISKANIDYVIFPHLEEGKVPFSLEGEGDPHYLPFLLRTDTKNLLAFPRNFPISQEIWRPITKMKRDEVKNQGYMLGDYSVFKEEYMSDQQEHFPIEMKEGVELYKSVLRKEMESCPTNGVLVYIQDLELMDFGDIALEIMEKAWKELMQEESQHFNIKFVTPDQYIDNVLKPTGIIKNLPEVKFNDINWAPEIRLVLRVDGHYPPLGVTGVDRYDREKTGLYQHPHSFWEYGKYYCGIFDTLLKNFNINLHLPIHGAWMNHIERELVFRDNIEVKTVLYHRIMKRACNWGWRPTEGRQKLSCLKGYLICSELLKKLKRYPPELVLNRKPEAIDLKDFVGLLEILDTIIDGRVNYLKFGLEQMTEERGVDLKNAYAPIELVFQWKEKAVRKIVELYEINKKDMDFPSQAEKTLTLLQEYSQAVFMSTDFIQKIWSEVPDVEFMVDHMYYYLYDLYPPSFPKMLERVDQMSGQEIDQFFSKKKEQITAPV